MTNTPSTPAYTITPSIARALMEIEAAKAIVEHTPLSPEIEADLRHKARMRSTHYSTRIEGNRLTLKEAQDVIVDYFVVTLSKVFTQAKDEAIHYSDTEIVREPEKLRALDARARTVLALFAKKERVTSQDVAVELGLSSRMVRTLLATWVKDGFLVITNPSNRARAYALSEIYRQFVGNNRGNEGKGIM